MSACIYWVFLLVFLSDSRWSCYGFTGRTALASHLHGIRRHRFPVLLHIQKHIVNSNFHRACLDKTTRCLFRKPSPSRLRVLPDFAASLDPDLKLDTSLNGNLIIANQTLAAIRSGLTFEDVFGPSPLIPTIHKFQGGKSVEIDEFDEIRSIAESLGICARNN
jgi:hypothetical protein